MAEKDILVVIGATGKQGGSVVNSILGDKKAASRFSIRAVTRNLSKPAAQALTKRGIKCVKADLNDKASLVAAFNGAYAVFGVTDFWETRNREMEIQQGHNLADAAKETNIKHLVWSSMPDATKLSGGKYLNVVTFDTKANVERYIRQLGLPASFFLAGFYMSNIPNQMLNNATGVYNFSLAMPTNTPIPMFDAARDTGKFVKAMLLKEEKVRGKQIIGATYYHTPQQIIADFQAAKPRDGKGGRAVQLTAKEYEDVLASKGAAVHAAARKELAETMQLISEFGYYGGTSLAESHSILDEPLTTWKQFVEKEPSWAHVK
ncbi:hypothetical protein FQN57_001335 [Myotisia sp. PD_48]|nr:hypothetical protein FQN57_001335 [Myotisia sp. PD_48]